MCDFIHLRVDKEGQESEEVWVKQEHRLYESNNYLY